MPEDRLRTFLDDLGLIEFLDAFIAERIEFTDLEFLSEADLTSLGVPLGPRRRLLRALADTVPSAGPVSGERRNLTVMFCDMVDSTSVATHIDPEDLRTRYRAYRTACIAAIESEGGFVAHRMGDGLMAHFGFPQALEDAAIRAVRAGLQIVAHAADIDAPGGQVRVRVGIASGLTVIEAARTGLVAEDEMATGATLSLAARLQSLAEPDTVFVSNATRQMLHAAFELHPLGEIALKGFAVPEAVWRVTAKAPPGRLHETPESSPGVFFGREAVCTNLLGWWRDAMQGNGSAVLIEGEPGIGKSRLLMEIGGTATRDGEVVLFHCSRYRHGAALHPVLDWLEAEIGGVGVDDPERRLVELPGVSVASSSILAGLLTSGPQAAGHEGDPVYRQAAIIEAVVDLLATARGGSRLLLVEDLHWADDATLDVLDRLAECASDRALLVVATTRPDAARLPQESAFRKIALAPLSPAETALVIAAQPGAEALPENLRHTILERSGGIPFFAEELTRAVLEAPDKGAVDVPITLQDTLMSRLDRLDAGKPVALAGALIGDGFTSELLAACFDLPQARLQAGLAELVAANLVHRQPGPQRAYVFRHALVRDVAYGSILRSERSEMHRRVAEAIESRLPAMADARPEMVAHHFTVAGEVAPAVANWEKAAERASSHAAPKSAIAYFNTALDLLRRLPVSAARDEHETNLRIRLNIPLTVTTGFSSAETEDNLSRVGKFFKEAAPTETVIQLLWSRCMSALVRADLMTARSTALSLGNATAHINWPNAERVSDRILAYVAMLEGRLGEAETHFGRVLAGYSPEGFDSILPGHPFDVLASALSQRAILRALQGQAAEAELDQHLALTRARALDNLPTSFQVLVHICLARFEMGDHDGVVPLISELRQVVDRSELAPLYVNLWEAWLLARDGALDEGLAGMARAQKNPKQYPLWMPRARLLQAGLLSGAGRHHNALAVIDECAADVDRLRHTYLSAEVKRCRASCLVALGAPRSEVEALLRDAVDIATQQGARRFELAARRDLEICCR